MQTAEIPKFEAKILQHLKANYPTLLNEVKKTGNLTKQQDEELTSILEQFIPNCGLAMK